MTDGFSKVLLAKHGFIKASCVFFPHKAVQLPYMEVVTIVLLSSFQIVSSSFPFRHLVPERLCSKL